MYVRIVDSWGRNMGKVAVTYRIMPEGVDVDLAGVQDNVKKLIMEGASLARLDVKPVAFGLKFLEVILVMDDAANTSEDHEEAFRGIDGVQSVEITDLNLI